MPSIYDSYPPDQRDLAAKEEAPRSQKRPVRKDKGEIPFSKYMGSHPLNNRPFEKLLADWR